MSKFCAKQIRKSAEGIINSKDAERLIEELRNTAQEKVKSSATTMEDALRQTGKEMVDELSVAEQFEKYNRLLNVIKKNDALTLINSFKDKTRGLNAFLDGVQSNIKNSRFSVGALQKSNSQKMLSDLLVRLLKDDLLDSFKSSDIEESLAQEMFEAGSSKNESAKALSSVVRDTFNNARKLLRREGVPVGDLPEYMGRQSHNPERLLHAADSISERVKLRSEIFSATRSFAETRERLKEIAFNKWKNFINPKLDWSRIKYFGDKEEYLKEVHEGLVSGIHLTASKANETPGEFVFKGPGNLAKKLSQSRKLHFKDGSSWFEYNQRYGSGSVQDSIIGSLKSTGENLGLLQKMGTNPEAFLDSLIEDVSQSEKSNPKLKKSVRFAKDVFAELNGDTRIVVSNLSAKIGRAIRSNNVLAKLGLITLTSIADLAPRAALMREHGIGFLDRYSEGVAGLLKGRGDKERKILGALMGTYSDSHIGNMNAYFANPDTPSGHMTKAMQTFFKLSGNEWWDQVSRQSIGMTLSKNLALHKDVSFEGLESGVQRALRIYGIEGKEWDLFRKNGVKPHGNEIFITPDSAQTLSKEKIAAYLGKSPEEVSPSLLDRTRIDLEDRLRTFFIDQTDSANVQPSASDRALIIRGTQPGTLWGEFARYVGQFKYYSIAFTKRVLGRALVGGGDQGAIDSLISGNADIMGLVEVMISSTALGYVAMSAKDIVKNREPRSPKLARTWLAAFLQGGGGAIYGDFLFGEYDRFGRDFTKTLLGPSAGTLDDVAKILAQVRGLDNPSNSTLHLVENNTPFINLWFTRTLLDYLFLDRLQERVSPGYKRRMKHRLEKENGQKFLFNP